MTAEYWEDPVHGYFNWWSGQHAPSVVRTLDMYMAWRDGAELPPLATFPNLTAIRVPVQLVTAALVDEIAQTGITSLQMTMGQGSIPAVLWELVQLEHLDLSGNEITSLEDRFGDLPLLRTLSLAHNQLTELPPSALGLRLLVELNLEWNPLAACPRITSPLERLAIGKRVDASHLPATLQQLTSTASEIRGSFALLTELRKLSIRTVSSPLDLRALEQLKSLEISAPIDDPMLDHLPQTLESLILGGTSPPRIPSSIARFQRLRELVLPSGELCELPPELATLPLTSFVASATQLRDTHTYAHLPATLETLVLGHVGMKRWPARICELRQLRSLALPNNPLALVPPEMARLTELEELDLERTELLTLPPELGALSKLRKLALRGNELTAVPSTFAQLRALEDLDLVSNRLAAIPAYLSAIRHLQAFAQRV